MGEFIHFNSVATVPHSNLTITPVDLCLAGNLEPPCGNHSLEKGKTGAKA